MPDRRYKNGTKNLLRFALVVLDPPQKLTQKLVILINHFTGVPGLKTRKLRLSAPVNVDKRLRNNPLIQSSFTSVT
jgi:hypothetical protein